MRRGAQERLVLAGCSSRRWSSNTRCRCPTDRDRSCCRCRWWRRPTRSAEPGRSCPPRRRPSLAPPSTAPKGRPSTPNETSGSRRMAPGNPSLVISMWGSARWRPGSSPPSRGQHVEVVADLGGVAVIGDQGDRAGAGEVDVDDAGHGGERVGHGRAHLRIREHRIGDRVGGTRFAQGDLRPDDDVARTVLDDTVKMRERHLNLLLSRGSTRCP